jgi:hypothetical protein
MGVRTTAGSTNAVQPSSFSKSASTKDTAAEPSRMMTSWSLNCSRISSQMGVGGSSGSAVRCVSTDPLAVFPHVHLHCVQGCFNLQFLPCFCLRLSTCCALRPFSSVTWNCLSASAGVLVNAFSMPTVASLSVYYDKPLVRRPLRDPWCWSKPMLSPQLSVASTCLTYDTRRDYYLSNLARSDRVQSQKRIELKDSARCRRKVSHYARHHAQEMCPLSPAMRHNAKPHPLFLPAIRTMFRRCHVLHSFLQFAHL